MKKGKDKARRGGALRAGIGGLIAEWGFTALMVAAMGIGVGVVLWVAFGASFAVSVAFGLIVSVALAIVMWFAA